MKKVIGIIGVTVFTVAMFMNTNSVNSSKTALNLESLISLNTADAECSEWAWPQLCNAFDRCSSFGSGGGCDVH